MGVVYRKGDDSFGRQGLTSGNLEVGNPLHEEEHDKESETKRPVVPSVEKKKKILNIQVPLYMSKQSIHLNTVSLNNMPDKTRGP